jgi:type III secretion protein J
MSALPRRWIACGLALVVVACTDTLRSGLSEHQANQITLALDGARIGARKVAGRGTDEARYAVQVARSDMADALRVLEREQLPRPDAPGFAELYDGGSLVATPGEERARWAAATAGELSRSLERIAGVADARVHLALGEAQHALDAATPPAKASVLIRRKPHAGTIDETAVSRLVAGSVDGLVPEQVAVISVAAERGLSPAASLVRVGPISVTRSSALALKALLGAALTLDLLLAVAVVLLWRSRRRAQRASI